MSQRRLRAWTAGSGDMTAALRQKRLEERLDRFEKHVVEDNGA